ncbi:hypothetical protein CMI37_38625 [Candidatus Pacearchaeota archaeon]|jgi:hypothetical protein|nr:hypothetical protein [Candidatus Pacearchaeota archaeon]|tara:strand:+ start:673 stop:885 length:213 start_codon:yes stop_codon:yes gene_type:complete
MDATMLRRQERRSNIKKIVDILKEGLREEKHIDNELFIVDICIQFDVTERTAKEYIKIARRVVENGSTID